MSTNIVKYRNLPGKYPRPPDPWTPAELSSSAWYDAADANTIAEFGGLVTQWDDKSGNNKHVIQGQVALQPGTGVRTINGLNALDFNFSDLLVSFTGFPSIPFDVFIVHQPDSAADGTILANGGAGTSLVWARTDGVFFGDNQIDETVVGGQPKLIQGYYAGGGTAYQRINGSDTPASAATNIVSSSGRISIGAYSDSGTFPNGFNYFDGMLAEILIFASVLGDADRQKMEGYLLHKWGFQASLPVGHPYKDNPPYL